MIALISGALKGVWKYIVIGVMGAGLLLAIMLKLEAAGAMKERIKQRKKVDEKVETAKRVRRKRRTDPADRSRVSKFDRKR